VKVFRRFKDLFPPTSSPTPAAPRAEAPAPTPVESPHAAWPFSPADFDRLGKTGETIGERMVLISSRLADLQALQAEFVSFSAPVHEFLESHAHVQARLAETEALLNRARNENDNVRLEVAALRRSAEDLKNELAESRESRRHLEEAAEEREYQLKNAKAAAEEAQSSLDWAQRQLASEVDKAKGLTQTNRRLGGEIERLEQQIAEERARAVKLQDAATFSEGEIIQLRDSLDRLQPLYATSKRRLVEVEAELQGVKQNVAGLEMKLVSEREARQNAEELREQDRVAFESELAFATTQFESLSSRHDTTVKLLEQARALIAEKSEETRMADRALKEAVSERTAVERRVTVVQEEARRLATQLSNADELLQDTKGRCAMLTKALAAKDALVAQQSAKNDSLTQQSEAAALRFEQERAERETSHRKLIEELERERAERALAQGALSIARASREKLIEQLEAIKRKRPGSFNEESGQYDAQSESELKLAGNVHAFRSQESALEK
jgi:crescentin